MKVATLPATPSDSSELLALAVHEFRTPVTVVAGYLRMLARDQAGPLTDLQRKLVEEAERSCARLSGLVGEMSDLASLESGGLAMGREPIDLPHMLGEVAGEVMEGRDRAVVLQVEAPEEAAVVLGDRKRLRDAFAMLLTAVLREQGGPCTVRAICRPDGAGLVRVGIGVGDAATSVLTPDPAAQLNETRGGLGLALPIARRVITALGGQVWSTGPERHIGAIGLHLPLKEHSS